MELTNLVNRFDNIPPISSERIDQERYGYKQHGNRISAYEEIQDNRCRSRSQTDPLIFSAEYFQFVPGLVNQAACHKVAETVYNIRPSKSKIRTAYIVQHQ